MPLRPVKLPDTTPGHLWLSSMPGRLESWRDFLAEAKRARLALVLCLTPLEEIAIASPEYHRAIERGTLSFPWTQLPMENYGLPLDEFGFRAGIERAALTLEAGKAVLLHCAAGLGRTGTAAACVLKRLGLDSEAALRRVREAGSNPENARQSGLVDWF